MTPPDATSPARRAAGIVLAALLVLLAFRLTANETLRDTLAMKIATAQQAATAPAGEAPEAIPFVGPAFTAAYATIAFLLAGAAAFLGGGASIGAMRGRRLGQLALIGLILALLLGSTWHAANRFHALIGTADIAAALCAAWTVAVLCHDALLGRRGRQAVIAAVVALCALGCARALLQKYIEFPDMAQMVRENPDQALRNAGINPDDPVQRTLFLARLNSREVTGFGALANVFASQMVAAIALLAGLGAAGIWLRKTPAVPPPPPGKGRRSPPTEQTGKEIPLHVLGLVAVGLLLIVSGAVLTMTHSNGGMAAAALAAFLIVLGVLGRHWVAAWRRWLIAGAAVAAILLPIAVVAWGLTHQGLPTRSLLFRWHYWTGAAPMIVNSPVWGVGLHNFGDYYKRYKLPGSPEDVQDPHGMFVRLAAEAGLPAALLIGTLILWTLWGAWRQYSSERSKTPEIAGLLRGPLILGGCGTLVWLGLHLLAESPNEYTLLLTFLLAMLGWGIFAAVLVLLDALEPLATRVVCLTCIVGALAMLLYDQVNMALVTGPVAMLFWIMLAVGDSSGPAPGSGLSTPQGKQAAVVRFAVPSVLLAASAAWALALWFPLAGGAFPWDPAPYEYAYIRQMEAGQIPQAAAALDAALERAPNSLELRLQRIMLRRDKLKQPVADDIRAVFGLDRANAAPRVLLALPDSDLPATERITALQEALAFDQQLEPQEPKRLTAKQIEEIKAAIARLQYTATSARTD